MLKEDEQLSIQLAFENYSYICGSPIFLEDHSLYNILFVRINQTCHDHIEQIYYFFFFFKNPKNALLSSEYTNIDRT